MVSSGSLLPQGGLIRKHTFKIALRPPPEALPWKRYLLWALLVLGVALLGVLARSAAQEMNSQQAPPSSE